MMSHERNKANNIRKNPMQLLNQLSIKTKLTVMLLVVISFPVTPEWCWRLTVDCWLLTPWTVNSQQWTVNRQLEFTIPMLTDLISAFVLCFQLPLYGLVGKSLLTEKVFNQLTNLRAAKTYQIQDYFETLNNHSQTVREDLTATACVNVKTRFPS